MCVSVWYMWHITWWQNGRVHTHLTASTPQGTASCVLHNRAKGRIDSWLSSGSLCDLMQVVLLEKAWNATPNLYTAVLPSPLIDLFTPKES